MSDERCCPDAAGDSPCCGEVDRRSFLLTVGSTAALANLPGRPLDAALSAIAGPFDEGDTIDHFVPADKKLAPHWVRSLFERGASTWYSGADLATIGMPVGGICAGQIYLTGDGRLVYWDIFNEQRNTGYGRINYREGRGPTDAVRGRDFEPANDVMQGAAVRVRAGGRSTTRALDARAFPGVRFCGEYPIGRVVYEREAFPVRVELEAFSPLIPLEPRDSALPCTILNYTIENTTDEPVEATLAGWLENAVMLHSASSFDDELRRTSRAVREDDLAIVVGGARVIEQDRPPVRPPIVFADFEGEDYGDWTIEGEAFGEHPAMGTLKNQQSVSGFEGRRLVNSFLGGDGPEGRLVSPTFMIERPWIGFLVGGGSHEGETCINLVIDGEIARAATGHDRERLAVHNWDVHDLIGKRARIEIVDRASGAWGHINIDQIEFRDEPMPERLGPPRMRPDWGTMAITALGPNGSTAAFTTIGPPDLDDIFERDELDPAGPLESTSDDRLLGIVRRSVRLQPGERATVPLLVTWCLPNLAVGERAVGNYYAKRFAGAGAVARYVAANLDRLAGETHLWHRTYYDGTLPHWLLDRIGATICNLATTTCQWWRNGRFWAYEGCGCCRGTCGHVWNYEHAMARLFPSLERSVREMQDFAAGIGLDDETGAVAFRGEGWGHWAGDAQAGCVLKAYREHLCSADDAFLNRNWRHIRLVMQFLIDRDANADGLIESRQHNTYDIDYYGANTMVGSLYLGALRAAEEMARIVGDGEFAARCRTIFAAGRDNSMQRLFNGEYFIQDVDLSEHPDWQYAQGCLADQLFGQGWAHQVGLGYIYPPEAVRTALDSIWTYCWSPDVARQNEAHKPERWFARPGEAGLLTCTWPKSKHLGPRSTRYRDEVWTGIEYQVASNMAWEGMLTEALAICRAIHERYHPSKRNPFNEVECGDHYARSLASWGMITALSGFDYDGPMGHIGFAPRLTPERFRCVFTAADGWGTFEQRRERGAQSCTIELARGELRLNSIALETSKDQTDRRIGVTIDGEAIDHDVERDGDRVLIRLQRRLEMNPGETIEIVAAAGPM